MINGESEKEIKQSQSNQADEEIEVLSGSGKKS